jgi:hypothetical protein
LQWWADHLDHVATGQGGANVIEFRQVASATGTV